jgi:hypothetical protein
MDAELFDFFAKAYVWRHPSRSTTLYDLGADFAGFLERSQPAATDAAAALAFSFPAQLAHLERVLADALLWLPLAVAAALVTSPM